MRLSALFILLTITLLGNVGCQTSHSMEHPYTNHLIHETSPYLLQHAHNPVDWYPWNEEALARAKKENKLLLISIGYSSCHWCHVMEQESFEDTTVAAFMNKHFINIKVDREERPDIDDVYMTACQLSSGGSCGWPLNSFALPDGRPVWAGTYFPKTKWLEVLDYFQKTWSEEPDKMEDYAGRLIAGVRDHGLSDEINESDLEFSLDDIHEVAGHFMSRVDPVKGGRQGAPKFPMPNNWQYLMHYAYRYDNAKAKELCLTTLDGMMEGGIYDQLEGGFARYSTDAKWLVPHFEKMLYDNGQLVSLYAMAYAWTGNAGYLEVATSTLAFIEKYWMDSSGGIYSSFDADSENEEGKYYVWTIEELNQLIPLESDRELFYAYNDIRPSGNWEHGKNILQRHRKEAQIAHQLSISVEEFNKRIRAIHRTLAEARSRRIHPGLDDKILTSWNGLILQGYIDTYRVTSSHNYLDRAKSIADFLIREMIGKDYQIQRNYKNGKATINGFLDDYATVIQAFLSLYQVTFDMVWLEHAQGLTEHVIKHFDGGPQGFFYYTSDLDPPLAARRIDFSDNVISSGNSIMARNLLLLGEILYNEKFTQRSKSMFAAVWPRLKQDGQPSFYSNWCQLMLSIIEPPYEIAIVGKDYKNALAEMLKAYEPDAVYLGGPDEGTLPLLKYKHVEGETLIYVCQNKTCKRPVTEIKEAFALMKE